MRRPLLIAALGFALLGLTLVATRRAIAQTDILNLKMSAVMTAEEQKEAGLAGLTAPQRRALDAWLNRYTESVIKITVDAKESGSVQQKSDVSSGCAPNTMAASGNSHSGEGSKVPQYLY